jgi:hypothetical protein
MSPEWAAAYVKVRLRRFLDFVLCAYAEVSSQAGNAVQKMSLNDKATIATGVGILASNCIGNIAAVPSVNFTGLCLEGVFPARSFGAWLTSIQTLLSGSAS